MTLAIGRYTLYYYLCSGKNPLPDHDLPLKSVRDLQAISLLTFILHVVIPLRIYVFKRKVSPANPTTSTSNATISKESLTDLVSSLVVAILFSSSSLVFTRANKIPVADFNCYPNYLLEYYIRMIWPSIFGLAAVVLIYHRNRKLLNAVKSELQDCLYRISSLFTQN